MLRINLLTDEGTSGRRPEISHFLARFSGLQQARDAVPDPWGLALIATSVLAVAGVGWSWHSQSSRAARLDDDVTSAVADSARLADLMSVRDSLQVRDEEIRRRFERVARLERDRDAWARTLHAVATSLPGSAWLTEIRERDPLPGLRVTVRGRTRGSLAASAYARDLKAFGWIERVQLEAASRVEAGEPDDQSFTLIVDYRVTESREDAAAVLTQEGG